MASINERKLEEDIVRMCREKIPEIAQRFKDELERQFLDKLGGKIPHEWINEAKNDIIIHDPVYANGGIYCEVGWFYESEWENARVQVGFFGNHERQDNITVKPGIPTWQHELVDPRIYNSKKDKLGKKPLPQFDKESGIDVVDEATKIFQSAYNDMIEQLKDYVIQNIDITKYI